MRINKEKSQNKLQDSAHGNRNIAVLQQIRIVETKFKVLSDFSLKNLIDDFC